MLRYVPHSIGVATIEAFINNIVGVALFVGLLQRFILVLSAVLAYSTVCYSMLFYVVPCLFNDVFSKFSVIFQYFHQVMGPDVGFVITGDLNC